MLEQFVLGVVQGITEWIPISSEGMVVLTKTTFFADGSSLASIVQQSVLLNIGTFFAALLYLRKDVIYLLYSLFKFNKADEETKDMLRFLFIATIITGIVGFGLYQLISEIDGIAIATGKSIAVLIGVLLLVTGFIQVRLHRSGERKGSISNLEASMFGFIQGLAALPGLSRSGITISTFLLRGFNKTYAVRTSFIMALPVLLGGSIILLLDDFVFTSSMFIGLFTSFIISLLTMHLMLKVVEKINFGYVVLIFAAFTLVFAML